MSEAWKKEIDNLDNHKDWNRNQTTYNISEFEKELSRKILEEDKTEEEILDSLEYEEFSINLWLLEQ